MSPQNLWKRFQQHLSRISSLGLTLDISRMRFEDDFLDRMAAPMQQGFEAMNALERGAIANPDERRMVGHCWLRAPDLASSPEIAAEINHPTRLPYRPTARSKRAISPPTARASTRGMVMVMDSRSFSNRAALVPSRKPCR